MAHWPEARKHSAKTCTAMMWKGHLPSKNWDIDSRHQNLSCTPSAQSSVVVWPLLSRIRFSFLFSAIMPVTHSRADSLTIQLLKRASFPTAIAYILSSDMPSSMYYLQSLNFVWKIRENVWIYCRPSSRGDFETLTFQSIVFRPKQSLNF